jgi:iron(II)-dependent oxidoreductase
LILRSDMDSTAEKLITLYTSAREVTIQMMELADEKLLHESPGFGFRPIIWHLAHIGVFEGYWLLQKLGGQTPIDARYDRIFDPINTPREASVNLPSKPEMRKYLDNVRSTVLDVIESTSFDDKNPLLHDGYLFDLVLQHEYQHQETLAYLFNLLDPAGKTRPLNDHITPQRPTEARAEPSMVEIPGGIALIGAGPDEFAYDNERPQHEVELGPFRIGRYPVTNREFAEFVDEGGYERREFWSEEGWSARERESWNAPVFWTRGAEGWTVRGMFSESLLEPDHPVSCISWYEADACARFMKKRLPTEAEWETAASWDAVNQRKRRYAWGDNSPSPEKANYGMTHWGTTPVDSHAAGESATGCFDMTGNVWEWAADPFAGYRGFEAFPYKEYSEEWFDGDHRVLKGGSWATQGPLLRTSFRNFFRRQFRIAFAGFRCASDA